MNVSKMKEIFNEVIEVLLYPIFEKNEIAATHRCNLAKKKKKKKPSTLNPNIGVIPADKYYAMLAKMNGTTTPAQPTTKPPETGKRPNIKISMARAERFHAALARMEAKTPTKPTARRTEKFSH